MTNPFSNLLESDSCQALCPSVKSHDSVHIGAGGCDSGPVGAGGSNSAPKGHAIGLLGAGSCDN